MNKREEVELSRETWWLYYKNLSQLLLYMPYDAPSTDKVFIRECKERALEKTIHLTRSLGG